MPWKSAPPCLLAGALILAAVPAAAGDNWRAFVCRVTDWPDCERNTPGRRIYPDPTLYPDQDSCLAAFGQRFEHDPQIADRYPQTREAGNSYVYDCEAVNPPAGRQGTSE